MTVLILAKELPLTQLLLWIGVVIAVLIGASFGVMWYRARVLGKDQPDTQGGMLDELRAMRDRGELSPEEFDAAKHAMVSRLTGKSPPAKPAAGAPTSKSTDRVAPPGFDLTGQPLPTPPQSPEV